jgi:hypothetical protein
MLSSDWLMKEVFFTNSEFFQLFHHCRGYLQISRTIGKYPARDEIPSLNSLWRHGCNSNYSGFFFQPTLKVKKMTTVSAVMFEIVEMYIFQIHLHYFFCMMYVKNKTVIYSIFEFVPEMHFFEKIFPVFVD